MRSSLALIGALAFVACESGNTIDSPKLSVYRLDPSGCIEICQESGGLSNEVARPSGELCAQSSGSPCEFDPGRDRIRVVVDYGDFEFDDSVLDTKLTTSLTGNPVGESITLEGRETRGKRAYAVAEFPAPLGRQGSLQFIAKIDEGFRGSTDTFTLKDPSLGVSFVDCGSPCRIPAGSTAFVELDVPHGIDEVELSQRVDGVQQAGAQKVNGVSGQIVRVAVGAPDRPHRRWQLVATGNLLPSAQTDEADLAEPEKIQLGVVATNATAESMADGVFPSRVALEATETCRTGLLVVRASEAEVGSRVSVDVSSGAIGLGGAKSAVLLLDEDGLATTPFDLGRLAVPNAQVEFSAKLDGVDAVSRTWYLEPLRPERVELFLPASPQDVGEGGTPEVTVTGYARAPFPEGADVVPRFSAGTEIAVQITARPSDPNDSPCGQREPANNINCNRRLEPGLDVERGGCSWTPDPVTLGADGGFTIKLPGRRCFVGDLDFKVQLHQMETSAGACLGESGTATDDLLVEATLTYVPADGEDGLSGASGSGGG